jgi:hypothetical protein
MEDTDEQVDRDVQRLSERVARRRRSTSLAAVLVDLDRRSWADVQLRPDAERRRKAFEEEEPELRDAIASEIDGLVGSGHLGNAVAPPPFPDLVGSGHLGDAMGGPPAPRDLLHVYGPDASGTGGASFYRLRWTEIDGGPMTGIDARVDLTTGNLVASHFTTGSSWMTSYAALGVRMTPLVDCHLSIRPLVNWSGFDILNHRVFDGSLGEVRWATATGELRLVVSSTKTDGSLPNDDHDATNVLWSRSEANPSGTRDYSGTESPLTGFEATILASKDRRYSIFVVAQASVIADPGFAVATRASSSLACDVPYIVAQELP